MITLTFHGAAGCVTGFCALLRTDHGDVLIDCGMFQGPKTLRALNHDAFPFEAASIESVLLTHAHIDHSTQCHSHTFRTAVVGVDLPEIQRARRALCSVHPIVSGELLEGPSPRCRHPLPAADVLQLAALTFADAKF